MSTKLETEVNYLMVTKDSGKTIDFPKKGLHYDISNEILRLFKLEGGSFGDPTGYPLELTGTVNLDSGASGSVDGITVNGVEIMSSSVPFNASLNQTAIDAAANITAHTSIPNYTAIADGPLVVIKNEAKGVEVDGLDVVSSATTIATTDAAMGFETGGIVDSLGDEFSGISALKTFLRTNTGNAS